MFRDKVLHVMRIAVLLIQYCLGYLAPSIAGGLKIILSRYKT